jgi:hypothetical protein
MPVAHPIHSYPECPFNAIPPPHNVYDAVIGPCPNAIDAFLATLKEIFLFPLQ